MKKSITLFFIFIILFFSSCSVYDLSVNNLPKGELLSTYSSPNEINRLNIYLCNGGATTDLSIRGEVESSDGEKKNIYWQYHCDNADVEWVNDDIVIINDQILDINTDVYDFRQNHISGVTSLQSQKNFEVYKTAIENVVEQYGYEVSETKSEDYCKDQVYKVLFVKINDNERIKVEMANLSFSDFLIGDEKFSVNYELSLLNQEQYLFDTKLFVDIVNVISYKEISQDFCDGFLSKSNVSGENLEDQHRVGSDWCIGYSYNDDFVTLYFGGVTKQLKE